MLFCSSDLSLNWLWNIPRKVNRYTALRTLLVYTTKNRALFQFCEIIETQIELRFGTDFKFLDIFQLEECVFVERFYEKRK